MRSARVLKMPKPAPLQINWTVVIFWGCYMLFVCAVVTAGVRVGTRHWSHQVKAERRVR